jgi:hypothetical protein
VIDCQIISNNDGVQGGSADGSGFSQMAGKHVPTWRDLQNYAWKSQKSGFSGST